MQGDAWSSQFAHKLLDDSLCTGIRITLARDLIKAINPLKEENPPGAHGKHAECPCSIDPQTWASQPQPASALPLPVPVPGLVCPSPVLNPMSCSSSNLYHLNPSNLPGGGFSINSTGLLLAQGGILTGKSSVGTKQVPKATHIPPLLTHPWSRLTPLLLGVLPAPLSLVLPILPRPRGLSAQPGVITFQPDAISPSIRELMRRAARATGTLGLTCLHLKA